MATEKLTYYALRETDEPEATGLFRTRITETAMHLEYISRGGAWIQDNDLLRYLTGRDTGAEKASETEAATIAWRLGPLVQLHLQANLLASYGQMTRHP